MCPVSIVNGPIHNDIRLPECFIACYRRLDSRVRREGKEREKKKKKKRKRGRDEGTPVRVAFKRSFGPFCSLALTPTPPPRFFCFLFFVFFCSLLFELSSRSERLQQAKCFSVLLSLFFKTLFSYFNCN